MTTFFQKDRIRLQSPWEFNDLKLDLAQQRVEIRLKWPDEVRQAQCPEHAKSTQIFRKLPNPYSLLLRQAEVDSNPSSEERL